MNLREIPDNEQYAQQKKQEYKQKKMRQQAKDNQKSAQGFGYDYKPIQFDYSN
jgi:hypothetical protein